MISAIIVIITTSLVFVIFRLFHHYQVNVRRAVIVNYIAAVAIALIYNFFYFDFHLFLQAKWIIPAIIIGIIYVLNFYTINISTKKFNLAVTALVGKISVVLPILAAYFILNEQFTQWRVVGIILALFSIYLILKPSKKDNLLLKDEIQRKFSDYLIPVALFLFYGVSDSLFQISQKKLFYSSLSQNKQTFGSEIGMFVLLVFIVCLIFSVFFSFIKKENPLKYYQKQDIIGGIILGITNLFSGFFLILAVAGFANTAILFTFINISVVLLTTLIGFLFFREKLSLFNIIGISFALLALLLLNMN